MNAHMTCRTGIGCCSYVEFKGMNLDDIPDWKPSDVIECLMKQTTYVINKKIGFGHVLITAAYGDGGPLQDYLTFKDDVILDRIDSLKKYIRKHKLGKLHTIPAYPNPNHDTEIVTMIFVPDTELCREYCRKNLKRPRDEHIASMKEWGYSTDEYVI